MSWHVQPVFAQVASLGHLDPFLHEAHGQGPELFCLHGLTIQLEQLSEGSESDDAFGCLEPGQVPRKHQLLKGTKPYSAKALPIHCYIWISRRLQDIQPVYHWIYFESHHNSKFLSKGVKIKSSCIFSVFLFLCETFQLQMVRGHEKPKITSTWCTQPCYHALASKWVHARCQVHIVRIRPLHTLAVTSTQNNDPASTSPHAASGSQIMFVVILSETFFSKVISLSPGIQIYHSPQSHQCKVVCQDLEENLPRSWPR